MESFNTFWLIIIAVFAAGCAIGAIIFSAMSRGSRDTGKLKAELEEKERELQAYKSSVAGHFDKTSELVNELTQDYVKVYQHLSEGARNLGAPRRDMDLLEQQQGRVLIAVPDAGAPESGEDLVQDDDLSAGSDEPGVDAEKLIDEASREYISETIREAADIADKIDEEVAPASGAAGNEKQAEADKKSS